MGEDNVQPSYSWVPDPRPQLTLVSTYIRVCSKGMMTCRRSSLSAWKTGHRMFIGLEVEGAPHTLAGGSVG